MMIFDLSGRIREPKKVYVLDGVKELNLKCKKKQYE